MKYIIKILIAMMISSTAFAAKNTITKEEAAMLKSLENNKISVEELTQKKTSKKRRKIYQPAPVTNQASDLGFLVERDSPKIQDVRMAHGDVLHIRMCYSAAVTIALDESYRDELQRVIIDDNAYFEATQFQNNRGVLIRLKDKIPENNHWESALRLVTKSNDKTFLINLVALSCPKTGVNPYPKVYYVKEKYGLLNPQSKIMTPEDTIIETSEGLPRKNIHGIRVHDMVASSNSNWVVFGVEIHYQQSNSPDAQLAMKMLDNLQVNQIPIKYDFLKLQSTKFSEIYKGPTLRFKLSVNIDKEYVIKSRYVYFMLLDKSSGHYQYMMIDLLPYFSSLKKRGFNL
jgi:hypothetical protein